MDQTINETMEYILYKKRIQNVCTTWQSQLEKSFATNGRVIGKYGYVFYKEDGKLKQIPDANLVKYVVRKVKEQGLLEQESVSESNTFETNVATNLVNEM